MVAFPPSIRADVQARSPQPMEPYRFDTRPSAAEAFSVLETHGVVLIERFLARPVLERLRREHAELLERGPAEGVALQFDKPYLRSLKADPRTADLSRLPTALAVVDDPFLGELRSLSPPLVGAYPEHLIFQRTTGLPPDAVDVPKAFETHTDGLLCYRFMFYLSDVEPADGPLTLVPGAYPEYKAWRLDQMARGHKQGSKYRLLPELDDRTVPMTAPAGTLLAFYTDTPHRAGHIEPGHERLVFRINVGVLDLARPPEAASFLGRLARHLRR
jgi:hypothetical protein